MNYQLVFQAVGPDGLALLDGNCYLAGNAPQAHFDALHALLAALQAAGVTATAYQFAPDSATGTPIAVAELPTTP